jgi:hypothetical protein
VAARSLSTGERPRSPRCYRRGVAMNWLELYDSRSDAIRAASVRFAVGGVAGALLLGPALGAVLLSHHPSGPATILQAAAVVGVGATAGALPSASTGFTEAHGSAPWRLVLIPPALVIAIAIVAVVGAVYMDGVAQGGPGEGVRAVFVDMGPRLASEAGLVFTVGALATLLALTLGAVLTARRRYDRVANVIGNGMFMTFGLGLSMLGLSIALAVAGLPDLAWCSLALLAVALPTVGLLVLVPAWALVLAGADRIQERLHAALVRRAALRTEST